MCYNTFYTANILIMFTLFTIIIVLPPSFLSIMADFQGSLMTKSEVFSLGFCLHYEA